MDTHNQMHDDAMCGSDALGTPPRHTLRRVSGAGQRFVYYLRLASGCNTLASLDDLDDLRGRKVACSGRVNTPGRCAAAYS